MHQTQQNGAYPDPPGTRQDEAAARLILLNGPPGVGKSTLARRYLDEHPLTLIIEIDGLRIAMGGWAEHEESKLLARSLAVALARTHLAAGHDIVIPQYLGRPEFIDQLEALAADVDAILDHGVLADSQDADVERFRSRRAQLTAGDLEHPQADVADGRSKPKSSTRSTGSPTMASIRPNVTVVDVAAGDPYDQLLTALR